MSRLLTGLCASVLLAWPAAAAPPEKFCSKKIESTTRVTFAPGTNDAGWAFSRGSEAETIQESGGNPKEYLQNRFLSTAYPIARTELGVSSAFTGDYRARGVAGLAFDLLVFRNNLNLYAERYVSIVLVNDSGTPEAFEDDCFVFFTSDRNIPDPTTQRHWPEWLEYAFGIPSDSATLPQPNRADRVCEPGELCIESCPELGVPCWGWSRDTYCPTRDDANATWNAVISDVDQVWISFQHPEYFSLIQDWGVGLDNPAITTCSE
jgi:hypothetical protein